MATVKVPKKTTGAKATGTKAKATATKAKATNGRRTAEDVDKLVPAFVKHLTGGGTMRQLKEQHGFSDDGAIRQALARAGYDSKGQPMTLPKIAKTAKAIATARKQGHAWYVIALATGKTEAEVKKLAQEGGADVDGRVYVGGGRGK